MTEAAFSRDEGDHRAKRERLTCSSLLLTIHIQPLCTTTAATVHCHSIDISYRRRAAFAAAAAQTPRYPPSAFFTRNPDPPPEPARGTRQTRKTGPTLARVPHCSALLCSAIQLSALQPTSMHAPQLYGQSREWRRPVSPPLFAVGGSPVASCVRGGRRAR